MYRMTAERRYDNRAAPAAAVARRRRRRVNKRTKLIDNRRRRSTIYECERARARACASSFVIISCFSRLQPVYARARALASCVDL